MSTHRPLSHHLPPVPRRDPIARGSALLLALLTLTNVLMERRIEHFDCSGWWIDLRAYPTWLGRGLLWSGAILLLCYALRPGAGRWRRRATAGVALALALITLHNAITCWNLLAAAHFASDAWLPFSLAPAALLSWIAWRSWSASPLPDPAPLRGLLQIAGAAVVLGGGGALLLIWTFGMSDYRRQADAVVVFGARAYADGTPSDALYDRIRTGCELVRTGFARRLVVSGGPGDGPLDEPDVMRAWALRAGIPSDAILVDHAGFNTRATVANTTAMFREHGIHSVLAVSHGYHLARIKLAYQRAGVDVFTVPARQTRPLRRMPWYVTREVAALAAYWARP